MEQDSKKVLFITRNYPPMIGGLESYSRDFYQALKQKIDIGIIYNNRGKAFLPLFLIYCIFFTLLNRNKYNHVHLADGALVPIGCFIKGLLKKKVTITIHALDIIYTNDVYQWLVPKCINKMDHVIGVSQFSIDACVARGIDQRICSVIPNGIDFTNLPEPGLPLELIEKKFMLELSNRKILFSVGRLIRRKGISWFVTEVMPRLPEEYIYLIAGEGPEKSNIQDNIRELNLERRVYLLGYVGGEEKAALFQNSCLFIMPNISVPGDAEGFGISIIEAAAYGLPCLATNIEGIRDAVTNGVTGRLLGERDHESFHQAITGAQFDRNKIKQLTREKYDWNVLADRYREILLQ